jgi:hypothetical protein
MLRRNLALLLFFVCSLTLVSAFAEGPSTPAEKDVLVFANGDQLTGQFEGSTGGTLKFKSDMAGEITVGWDKIKELRANGRYAVLEHGFKATKAHKLDTTKIAQGTLSVENQTISVKPDAGAPIAVPAKDADFVLTDASYEKDMHGREGFLSDWNGAVTAGATLVRATQNSETFTGAVNLVRLTPNVSWLDPRTRDTADLMETYGRVTQTGVPAVETAVFHADAEHDRYFSPRAYGLGSVAFDHNYSQGLSLQQIYGGGVGLTVFKKPNAELDMKAQVQYETQQYSLVPSTTGTTTTATTHLIAATVAENYMRKFKTLTFNEQLQLIPAFNDANAYSAVAQIGVLFPVYKRFSFTASSTDTYLGDPASGALRNSFQFVTGITYKLR